MSSRSLLIPAVLAAAILLGALAFPFALFMEHQLQTALLHTTRSNINQDIQHLGAVLERHVRYNDMPQIEKILYSFMNDPNIAGIVLYSPQGEIRTSIRRMENRDLLPIRDLLLFRSILPKESYSVNTSLFYQGVFEGRLEVYINLLPEKKALAPFRNSLFQGFALFALLFMGIFTLLLHITLRRPLQAIRKRLEEFLEEDPPELWRSEARAPEGASPEIPGAITRLGRKKNELGALMTALLKVLFLLRNHVVRQEHSLEALEKNNTLLIEELCTHRQQKMDMEERIRDLEKRVFFSEKNTKNGEDPL